MTVMMLLISLAAVYLCVWRCSFGFSDDEPFYYTIPLRLIQGDSLFSSEWHLSQLSSFFLIPFVSLYTKFNGNTDGIIIFARYIYVAVHFLVSAYLFYSFRKNPVASFFAALSYFLFSPHEIMTYYYNTMTMDFLVVSLCLIAGERGEACLSAPRCLLSGFLFAAAVICCPYLLFAYIALAVFVLCTRRRKAAVFTGRFFLLFTAGAAVLAVIFLIFLFGHTSLANILESLPYILSDPEHPQITLRDRLVSIFYSTWLCHPLFHYALIAFGLELCIYCLIAWKRKALIEKTWVYFLLASVITAIFCYCIFIPNLMYRYSNALLVPLIFPGFMAFVLLDKSRKHYELFCTFFVCGLIYALCLCFTSNLFFLVMPTAIEISNIASMLFIASLLSQRKSDRHYRFACAAVILCVSTLFILHIYEKHEHSYYQFESTSELYDRIEAGPAKGIYTDKEKYEDYMAIYNDLGLLKDASGSIAYLSTHTWMYLETDNLQNGTYSAWLSGESSLTLDRLESYWELHPEKLPDYVYLPRCSYFDRGEVYRRLIALGYSIGETPGGMLAESSMH